MRRTVSGRARVRDGSTYAAARRRAVRGYSPRTRLMISVEIAVGTSVYCANCIV